MGATITIVGAQEIVPAPSPLSGCFFHSFCSKAFTNKISKHGTILYTLHKLSQQTIYKYIYLLRCMMSKLVADDIVGDFTAGGVPKLNRDAYLATMRAMFDSFPNFRFEHSDMEETSEDGEVKGKIQAVGTHTGATCASPGGVGCHQFWPRVSNASKPLLKRVYRRSTKTTKLPPVPSSPLANCGSRYLIE